MSFKLLEINVISAQDLPPVSNLLRTYAVAWVHPDHKLTTRVDHHGHTNPTWNYKLVFHVDDHFFSADFSAVTFEIYNVAWLRDIPIGTTRLPINNVLSPPFTRKNSTTRPLALQISRPSGHLQGILNVLVNIVDTSPQTMSLNSQLTISTVNNRDSFHSYGDQEEEERQQNNAKIAELQRSRSEISTRGDDFLLKLSRASSGVQIQPKATALNGSVWSGARPLPSEVAAALKNGMYSTAGDEVGSSIFDGWTVEGDRSDDYGSKSKVVRWPADDDRIPLVTKEGGDRRRRLHRRSQSDGQGLFSCFGNAYGFEFNFMCGSNSVKKNRKKLVDKSDIHNSYSDQNLSKLYI